MHPFHDDALARLELEERRARAVQARLALAARRVDRRDWALAARLGRLLIGAGTRLEAVASRQPTGRAWAPVGDPCRGCAN